MMYEWLIPLICGLAVGFSLGLTGGGGSIFAIPLLVYVIGASVRESVGISLIVVGSTAIFGAMMRAGKGEIEWKAGLIFAIAGMATAPLGTSFGKQIPDVITLVIFSVIMLYVGIRMWGGGARSNKVKTSKHCARCIEGKVIFTPKCYLVLISAGIIAGLLAGIFGVGGGFIIVPALIIVTDMAIHRAVSTSLLVIALICLSGIISQFTQGNSIPISLSIIFTIGGLIGMLGGIVLRSRLPEQTMRRIFAIAMWGIAIFILAKNIDSTY